VDFFLGFEEELEGALGDFSGGWGWVEFSEGFFEEGGEFSGGYGVVVDFYAGGGAYFGVCSFDLDVGGVALVGEYLGDVVGYFRVGSGVDEGGYQHVA